MTVAVTYTLAPAAQIKSSELNTNFNDLVVAVNAINTGSTTYGYRRPCVTFISVTTVDIENNTDTSNQTKVVFPDGESRSVTEDTSTASKYRRFIITETANFTSGTENSGLYTGLAETNNTWYALYAVKSQIDVTKFVLVGTTTQPTQGNMATLNTNLGASSWVYLGMIRNGDNGATAADLLNFYQSGAETVFVNTQTGGSVNSGEMGILLNNNASTTSLTYTYSAGTTTDKIPATVKLVLFCAITDTAAAACNIYDVGSAKVYATVNAATTGTALQVKKDAITGLAVSTGAVATKKDILLHGFGDSVL